MAISAPRLLLAADHRARGVMTIEHYDRYLAALEAAMGHCDGILATMQPLLDLRRSGAVGDEHQTYLSLNRTGLADSAFEIDDRLITSVERAAGLGVTGIKHMTRIDLSDPLTSPALELLGQVLEKALAAGLEALIEPLVWRDGNVARDTDSVVLAAVIAHDMGAPMLKVPVPKTDTGPARVAAIARVVDSVGVPVLFLGGARDSTSTDPLAQLAADVIAGGGAGLAVGRRLFEAPDPGAEARAVAEVLGGRPSDQAGE